MMKRIASRSRWLSRMRAPLLTTLEIRWVDWALPQHLARGWRPNALSKEQGAMVLAQASEPWGRVGGPELTWVSKFDGHDQ